MTDPPNVATALTDLAAAAGDEPLALSGIEQRARRVRVRRGAGRAAVVVVCCGGLAAGIALAGAGGPQRSQISASTPAPVVLTQCTTLAAGGGSDATAKGPGAAAPKTTAGAIAGTEVTSGLPEVGALFKAPGTVTGVPARDSVTILVAAPLYPKPRPVIFAITAQTAFQSGGEPMAATILRTGSHVGFVATRTGPDSFRLELIETNPDAASKTDRLQPKTTGGPLSGAPSPNASDGSGPPKVGGTVEGKGTVTAVSSNAVSLAIKGGPLAGQTLSLTVTPASQFAAAGRQCDPSGLPAGTPMSFTATRTGSSTYRLDGLNI